MKDILSERDGIASGTQGTLVNRLSNEHTVPSENQRAVGIGRVRISLDHVLDAIRIERTHPDRPATSLRLLSLRVKEATSVREKHRPAMRLLA